MSIRSVTFACLFVALVGCSGSASPEKPASAAKNDSVSRQKFSDFEFGVPDGWTRENVGGGLLLMAPDIENNWQANLFLEIRDDPEGRTLELALADLATNLEARKEQFHEVSRKIVKHSGGFNMGILEYTWVEQGSALTELEIIIEAGSTKRFFVLASSASASWAKYQPMFQRFIESLKKTAA